MKKALVLVNVGTPDKPEVKYVRRYLSEFLNDPRVIDIPWILRKILVNLIIVPFRAPKSTLLYKKLWTPNGSPLLASMNSVVNKLSGNVNYDVYGAMRYGNPSLGNILKNIKNKGYEEILFFPLFPQYASSTTGSVSELIFSEIRKWNTIPSIRIINSFYRHPAFIRSFVSRIQSNPVLEYDHIVFSYHGLPLRHIRKIHPQTDINQCTCHLNMPEHGTHCYRAACYETTRLLAKELSLKSGFFTTSFQSRLSKDWLTPFTDQTLIDLAKSGKKKILIVAPSFVADCLETIVELADEYEKLFKKHGGEKLTLVKSLNDHPEWIEGIKELITNYELKMTN